jgi:hypothetical protein
MRILITALVAAGLVLPLADVGDDDIGSVGIVTGNDGTGVNVSGTHTDPGDPGNPGNPGIPNGPSQPWYPPAEFDFETCLVNWDSYMHCFRPPTEEENANPSDDEPAIPPVTISDVARFLPAGTTLAAEPDNVGVAGLPTNFVAAASEHTTSGELFGYPISVRFTPVGYDFDYGDGSTASTTEGGRSWADLDQAQFTPTPTSHTYSARGEYLASVDVRYTAEIDLGIGWFPLSGELTAPGPEQEIRIFEAHTALVAYTCEQSPDSPGC